MYDMREGPSPAEQRQAEAQRRLQELGKRTLEQHDAAQPPVAIGKIARADVEHPSHDHAVDQPTQMTLQALREMASALELVHRAAVTSGAADSPQFRSRVDIVQQALIRATHLLRSPALRDHVQATQTVAVLRQLSSDISALPAAEATPPTAATQRTATAPASAARPLTLSLGETESASGESGSPSYAHVQRGVEHPNLQRPEPNADSQEIDAVLNPLTPAAAAPAARPHVFVVPAVVDIGRISDPTARNHAINQNYHAFDSAFTGYFGTPLVSNWFTFGQHASREAGAEIRNLQNGLQVLDDLLPTLQALASAPTSLPITELPLLARQLNRLRDLASQPGLFRQVVQLAFAKAGIAMEEISALLVEINLAAAVGPVALVLCSLHGASLIGRLLVATPVIITSVRHVYANMVQGNREIYENLAPAAHQFLSAAQGAPDGQPGAMNFAGDPNGFMAAAFAKYAEVRKLGDEAAAVAGTPEETAKISQRRAKAHEGNLLIGFQEQLIILQPIFDTMQEELRAMDGTMSFRDPNGVHSLTNHWGDFYTRMGIDPATAPADPRTIRPNQLPALLGQQDPRRSGTISEYFESGLTDENVHHAPSANISPTQLKSETGSSGENVHVAAARGISGSSHALPFADKIQASFGEHDLSDIKAHTDTAATAGSKAMGAEAFATGDRVVFAGTPSLHTAAHEAAHVVQQRAGVHLKGGVGAAGDAYEISADAVADRVVAGKSAADLLPATPGAGAASTALVQRQADTRAPAGATAPAPAVAADAMTNDPQFEVGSANEASARTPHPRSEPTPIQHDTTQPTAHRAALTSASSPIVERQMALHLDIAEAQITNARARVTQLETASTGQINGIAQASQQGLAAISRWRRGIDQNALAELETDYTSVASDAGMELATMLGGAIADLNPISATVFHIVDGTMTIGGLIGDLQNIARVRELVAASAAGNTGSDHATATVLEHILSRQNSALNVFYTLVGRIQEATATGQGTSGGQIASAASRHRAALRVDLPLSADRVSETEATGLASLDRANHLALLVAQLEQAAAVIAQAPASIATQARQALARAQAIFATNNTGGAIAVTGTLSVSRDRLQLTVNNIGAESRSTPYSGTLRDMATASAPFQVSIQVTHPVLVPQIFARPTVMDVSPAQGLDQAVLTATLHGSGGIQWSGMTVETLGHISLTQRGLPPSDTHQVDREQVIARGELVRDQLAQALQETPLDQLRNVTL